MKNNHIKNLSLTFILSLSVLATEAVFAQQGRGNPNRPTPETEENESARSERQRGQADEKRGQSDDKRGKADEQRAQRGKPDEAGKERAKDEHKPDVKEKDRKDKNKKEYEKDKDKEGHAYGRDKEGLSGREFGQKRAADARRNNEQRRAALGTTVEDGDKKVKEANERIARAREELEQERRNKKINDAAYNERKARIERAERAVRELEEKVAAGRQLSVNVNY